MPVWIQSLWAPEPTARPGAPTSPCWFVRDPLGIVLSGCTWLLVLGSAWVLVRDLLLPSGDALYGVANGALFLLLAALALASHLRAMLTDPGSLPPAGAGGTAGAAGAGDAGGPAPDTAPCPCCGAARPPRAHHCLVCDRCVRGMDHHCPWVNNCVGDDNRRHFLLFTLFTALGSAHLLVLLGVPALRAWRRGGLESPPGSLLLLFLLALNAFLLAAVMFSAQLYRVCADTTGVHGPEDARAARRAHGADTLRAVCGPGPALAWLNPLATPGPRASAPPDAVV